MPLRNSIYRHWLPIVAVLSLATAAAAGCSPGGVAAGAGAAAGSAAMEDRGFGTAVDDAVIQTRINALWLDHDAKLFTKIFSEVHEGRVLLTGSVEKPQHRIDAVKIAWQVDGINEMINEIEITDKSDLLDSARDIWIVTQLRFKLTFDKRIKAINYSLDAVNGSVFVIGIARTEAELKRVVDHARSLSYVRRVTPYVRLKSDPIPEFRRSAATAKPLK
jgi:osmotically-inducible protein OsmY